MKKPIPTSKDQNWTDGTTTYWFDVDGETYGVVESEGQRTVVDCDGAPTTDFVADQFEITTEMVSA